MKKPKRKKSILNSIKQFKGTSFYETVSNMEEQGYTHARYSVSDIPFDSFWFDDEHPGFLGIGHYIPCDGDLSDSHYFPMIEWYSDKGAHLTAEQMKEISKIEEEERALRMKLFGGD